eukprot:CAMPEP_0178768728 /NCGR_PEP_ID=MMETSP0744-20121128/20404_1 /TAXON_ID=913974 /ORGANISM="Nitzschia punctata, Strain CCMP561" /LENGTH=68 /DNA_ID=CAMNT_0020424839 /DNA_START=70 /DNA_END=272 /DNA_ORIENTATION=+
MFLICETALPACAKASVADDVEDVPAVAFAEALALFKREDAVVETETAPLVGDAAIELVFVKALRWLV